MFLSSTSLHFILRKTFASLFLLSFKNSPSISGYINILIKQHKMYTTLLPSRSLIMSILRPFWLWNYVLLIFTNKMFLCYFKNIKLRVNNNRKLTSSLEYSNILFSFFNVFRIASFITPLLELSLSSTSCGYISKRKQKLLSHVKRQQTINIINNIFRNTFYVLRKNTEFTYYDHLASFTVYKTF